MLGHAAHRVNRQRNLSRLRSFNDVRVRRALATTSHWREVLETNAWSQSHGSPNPALRECREPLRSRADDAEREHVQRGALCRIGDTSDDLGKRPAVAELVFHDVGGAHRASLFQDLRTIRIAQRSIGVGRGNRDANHG